MNDPQDLPSCNFESDEYEEKEKIKWIELNEKEKIELLALKEKETIEIP